MLLKGEIRGLAEDNSRQAGQIQQLSIRLGVLNREIQDLCRLLNPGNKILVLEKVPEDVLQGIRIMILALLHDKESSRREHREALGALRAQVMQLEGQVDRLKKGRKGH